MLKHSQKLKAAILGGGINSAVGLAHLSALNLVDKFNIVSGCFSRNSDLNFESGLKYNIPKEKIYKTLHDMVENEKTNLDVIVILTPTDQHYLQVIYCLEHGIPVICEKALTTSLDDAREIQNIVRQKSGFLKVIYNYVGYPMLRELKKQIEIGKLGKINQVQIEMPQEGFLRMIDGKPLKPQDWRLKDNKVSTLSLDLGVHLHMIVKYITGEIPLRAVSISSSFGNFKDVLDNSISLIEYSNDVVCNMWFSKVSLGNRNGLKLRVYGTKGGAEWYQEESEILKMANSEGHRWIMDRGSNDILVSNSQRYTRFKVGHPAGFIEALANYYEDIEEELQAYIRRTPNSSVNESFGINEAFEGMLLLEALADSNISRQWVNLHSV